MSDGSPSVVTGNAAVHGQEALTPAAIEAALADFRSWLEELAARNQQPPAADPALAEAERIDLHTLLGQFVALRHEVNLQTRAVRAQQEQNTATLQQLSQALQALRQQQAAVEQGVHAAEEDQQRPFLKTLLEIQDALSVAAGQAQRVQEANASAVADLLAAAEAGAQPQLTGLAAWVARSQLEQHAAQQQQRRQALQAAAERVRQLVDSLVTGYTMSLRRLARTVEQYQLEPIMCVGRPFDPELMEVVETVADSGRPAGEVLDEVRRGYLWHGRVFRYAQVRVAKE